MNTNLIATHVCLCRVYDPDLTFTDHKTDGDSRERNELKENGPCNSFVSWFCEFQTPIRCRFESRLVIPGFDGKAKHYKRVSDVKTSLLIYIYTLQEVFVLMILIGDPCSILGYKGLLSMRLVLLHQTEKITYNFSYILELTRKGKLKQFKESIIQLLFFYDKYLHAPNI